MNTNCPPQLPLRRPIRLAVLISGGGTTLENLTTEIEQHRLDAEIPLVIASRDGCGGIAKARQAGLRCEHLDRPRFHNVNEFSHAVFQHCHEAAADLVLLAGFLSLIRIPDHFHNRVMNVHPALIPSFCGQGFFGDKVHEAVLKRGVKVSGCTVHFADNQFDHGPIILQRAVPVREDDTPQTLAARVFEQECEAYPEAIRLFASGRLRIEQRRVRIGLSKPER